MQYESTREGDYVELRHLVKPEKRPTERFWSTQCSASPIRFKNIHAPYTYISNIEREWGEIDLIAVIHVLRTEYINVAGGITRVDKLIVSHCDVMKIPCISLFLTEWNFILLRLIYTIQFHRLIILRLIITLATLASVLIF